MSALLALALVTGMFAQYKEMWHLVLWQYRNTLALIHMLVGYEECTQFANIIGGNIVESVKDKVMKDFLRTLLCENTKINCACHNVDYLDPLCSWC